MKLGCDGFRQMKGGSSLLRLQGSCGTSRHRRWRWWFAWGQGEAGSITERNFL